MSCRKASGFDAMLKRTILCAGAAASFLLLWFSISDYRSSFPLAEENLHGLALSLSAGIENIVVHDPSLRSLVKFRTNDIAYFALMDQQGTYRYHSNADLVGTSAPEAVFPPVARDARVTLGTGEKVYQFDTPLHLPGESLLLRLTLHTYRADAVVRRAKLNLLISFGFLSAVWALAIVLYRFARREEHHRIEMERRESLARLGEMGATLAHEIRNPLAGIKGYAQLIEKRPQDGRNCSFAGRIVAEVGRLESLVGDLLAFSRTESLCRTELNLYELLTHTAFIIQPEADALQVDIAVECPDVLYVCGNGDRLGQLLLNLCANALQAMAGGGALRIAARASGGEVELTVSDSGYGIDRENMPRIFDPFFTTKARGTGLGLALCRKIAEEHKGTIRVESELGRGTSVFVTIAGSVKKRESP